MRDTKEYILGKAFEVFLAKGYDSTSMTVLQQKLNMSRGAMYRYFDGKEALFRAVVDKYFWSMVEYVRPNFKEDITLLEIIEESFQHRKRVVRHLGKIEGIEQMFLNYTALMIQAAKYHPDFIGKWKTYVDWANKQWQYAIENSIKRGEVRADVNVKIMSRVFHKAVTGEGNDRTTGGLMRSFETSKQMMLYLYSLIKA